MSRTLLRTCIIGAVVAIAVASHCGIADAQLFRRWRGGGGDCCCYGGNSGYNNWGGGGYVSHTPAYSGGYSGYSSQVGDGCGSYTTQPAYQGSQSSYQQGGAYQGQQGYSHQQGYSQQGYSQQGYPQPYDSGRISEETMRSEVTGEGQFRDGQFREGEMRDGQFRDGQMREGTRIEQRTDATIQEGVPTEPRQESTPRNNPTDTNPSDTDSGLNDNTSVDSRIDANFEASQTQIETRQGFELNGELPEVDVTQETSGQDQRRQEQDRAQDQRNQDQRAQEQRTQESRTQTQERRTQESARGGVTRQETADIRATSDAGLNAFLASKLILANNAEIKCAQDATKKASSDEVKAFAKQLVQDHSKMNQQLQPHAAPYAEKAVVSLDGAGEAAGDQNRGENRVATDRPDAPPRTLQETGHREGADKTYAELYALCAKTHENADQLGKQMMDQLSGAEFDMAFVGSQIVKHQMTLAELKAMQSSLSGEMKNLATQAASSVEMHLEAAKQLAGQLKGKPPVQGNN